MMRKVGFLVAAIALAAFAGAPSDSFAATKKSKPKAEQSEQAKTPPDRQLGVSGYRAKRKTTAVQEKAPPDRQLGVSGYRSHKAKAQ